MSRYDHDEWVREGINRVEHRLIQAIKEMTDLRRQFSSVSSQSVYYSNLTNLMRQVRTVLDLLDGVAEGGTDEEEE